MSADYDAMLEEPSGRQRYCEIHECTYGWGCPECRDMETQRQTKEIIEHDSE